jgi:SAM-dependent methyltransferase
VTAYQGRHAELYDLFYADKPYAAEAEFMHACLQRYGRGPVRRLLELACGTGTHALRLEQHGYEIVATDYSSDLLECARRKATLAGARTDFRWQDMRALDVPERPFDAVFCLFDAIGYTLTNEGLCQVLQGAHRHLRPGGLFIFEFWHAAAMLRHYEPARVRRWPVPHGELLRLSETVIDPLRQVGRVTYSIYELEPDGHYTKLQEMQENRFFLVQEMAGWVEQCGFSPVRWLAGYSETEPITLETWHILAVVRRET